MKKMYFAPETIIVKVAMESLLSTVSTEKLGGEASETMSGFSREDSDWDD